MYNPNQPRDSRGRWTDSTFLDDHGDTIVAALTIGGFALATKGKYVAKGVNPLLDDIGEAASKKVVRAATVRKVGPIPTTGLKTIVPGSAKKSVPDSVEGYQYHKGFFSPNLPEGLTEAGRPIRDLRVGAEVIKGKKKRTIGAAKPLNYNKMNFSNSPKSVLTGKLLVGAGALYGTGRSLNNRY